MGKCKLCGVSGWLIATGRDSLCSQCQAAIAIDVRSRKRVMDDCIKLIDQSRKIETRLSRLSMLLEHAGALHKYETRGIATIDPPPSAVLEHYHNARDEIILDSLKEQCEAAITKARAATTTRTKLTPLSKVLSKIDEYRDQVDEPEAVAPLRVRIRYIMQLIELGDYLDKARKAEFKGQHKKALDQYYEALYFIMKDNIHPQIVDKYSASIRAKISELGGEIPPNERQDINAPKSARRQ